MADFKRMERYPKGELVYALLRLSDGKVKIGSTNNLYSRLAGLTTEHGELRVLGTRPGYKKLEHEIHILWRQYRTFLVWGKHQQQSRTEFFHPAPDLLAWIAETFAPLPIPAHEAEFIALCDREAIAVARDHAASAEFHRTHRTQNQQIIHNRVRHDSITLKHNITRALKELSPALAVIRPPVSSQRKAA